MKYTYNKEALRAWIERERIRKFWVQLPEGLMPKAFEILEELSEFGDATLYGQPSFGACDFPESFVEVDGLVHLGHAPIPSLASNKKIIFLDLRLRGEIEMVEIPEGLGKKVGIFASVQYLDFLPKISALLEEHGIETHIPKPSGRTYYAGQVLGCDVRAVSALREKVDSFLFIGDGDFHARGVCMLTHKPIFRCSLSGRIERVQFDRERFLREGILRASRLGEAKRVGVVVCTKPGQRRLTLANHLLSVLRKHGKNSRLIFLNNLSPQVLNYLDCDLLVSTACPRIALEDGKNYTIPLLTPQEALLGLGEKEEYEIDQFLEEHL